MNDEFVLGRYFPTMGGAMDREKFNSDTITLHFNPSFNFTMLTKFPCCNSLFIKRTLHLHTYKLI